jgi:hypothetical protein
MIQFISAANIVTQSVSLVLFSAGTVVREYEVFPMMMQMKLALLMCPATRELLAEMTYFSFQRIKSSFKYPIVLQQHMKKQSSIVEL